VALSEITDGPVLLRREDTTAVLTLNRPEQRNALNEEVLRRLRDVIEGVEDDPDVRAVVITGSGDRAFCAGADIRKMQTMTEEQGREWSLLGHDVFARIEDLPKPVIAAINGIAVGGGCELALACDFRFMAEAAQLGQPEIKLGLIPGWGGTQRLPRIVGSALAKDLILTGRLMAADEARRVGLIHGVAQDAPGVLQQALVYAAQFANLPPLAVAYAKHAIHEGADLPLREGTRLEAEQFGRCFTTEDVREGLAAFVEKRPAAFRGR
jgi:enoyl-CoA hydratase